MDKPIRVGVIGATGHIGSQLTAGLSRAEYPLMIYARDQKKIKKMEAKQVVAASDPVSLVKQSEVIFLAVPHPQVAGVAEQISQDVEGKIVVSVSNPVNQDYSGLSTGWDTSAGEELQKLLPQAKVVKAINTVLAGRINHPVIKGVAIDHFIAGDDQTAVEKVSQLVSALGHHPIWVGGLSESRTLEHMAFINISLSMQGKFKWNSAYKLLT